MTRSVIHAGGHEIAVVRGNEDAPGIPVIYVHGVLVSASFWPAVLDPVVADNHPWFSLSLPAHFPSRAPRDFRATGTRPLLDIFTDIYSDAIEQLVGDQRVIFIGHSTGGFAAITMALRKPEQLAAAISVAGFSVGRWGSVEGLLVEFGRRRDRLGKFLFRLSLDLMNATGFGYRAASLALVRRKRDYWRNALTHAALRAAHEDFRRSDYDDLYALFAKISQVDIRGEVPEPGAPLHLIFADRDPVIRVGNSVELVRQFPEAGVHQLAGIGHMIFLEEPAAYRGVLEGIFEELTSPSQNGENDSPS